MKIVKLDIDENSILEGIDAMALVEAPAIEETFYYFASEKFADTYNDYPESVVEAAKQGIKRNEALGNPCATQVGKVRAQQLANREPVSLDTVRRMRSFLIRQKDNYELARERKDYNACGYISYLLWGGESALPWTEKTLRQAGEEFAEVGPKGGVKASPKAPKSDTPNPTPKGEGTAKGSASTTRGAEVDAATEESLKKKADEFNERYKEKLGYGANVGTLKSVYQRGLGAYNTSRSPAVAARGGAKQWAMARVNAFLYLLKEGRPQNRNYTTDYDLLPKDHPKKKNFNQIMESIIAQKMVEQMVFSAQEIDVFGYNTKYFYICPGAIGTFNHLKTMNPDEETIGMIRSAAQIADNVFKIEADVLKTESATPEQLQEAIILVGDFKDLMHEIDEELGMRHDVSYMDGHIEVIKSYLSQEFELVVSGLPNYINEPTGELKVNKEASYGFSAVTDQQILVGPAMVPNKLIVRKDDNGDPYYVYFTEESIRKIAYKMMADKVIDKVNIEHDGEQIVDGAYLVESWIVEDPEKDKSLVYGFKPKKGEWMTMYKIQDKNIWDKYVKTGKVKGFSVEGYFSEKMMASAQTKNIHPRSKHLRKK
jgi:hypothetical protein